MIRNGHCLCGKVSFSAMQAGSKVGACHCDMCRRWGGGPYMEIECGADVQFTGAEYIEVFESSEWAERGFCRQCGTHLFYRLKANSEHMIPVGTFDDSDGLVFHSQVFVDKRPDYYAFANSTEDMTGEELFAKYAPK